MLGLSLIGLGSSMAFAQTQKVADLVLEPPVVEVAPGETFTVTIQAILNGEKVLGAETYLDFDPAYLEVVDADPALSGVQIEPGSTLPTLLVNEVDNSRGEVDYAAGVELGSDTTYVTSDFTVATVTFRAKSTGSSSIAFHFDTPGEPSSPARYTRLQAVFASVLKSTTGAGVGIGGLPPQPPVVTPPVSTSPPTPPAEQPETPPTEKPSPAPPPTPPAEQPETPPTEKPAPAPPPTPPAEQPETPPTEKPAPAPPPTPPAEQPTPIPAPAPTTGIAWWIWLIIGAVVAGLGSFLIVRRGAR